jgi:hypothetical protein
MRVTLVRLTDGRNMIPLMKYIRIITGKNLLWSKTLTEDLSLGKAQSIELPNGAEGDDVVVHLEQLGVIVSINGD